MDSLGNKLLKLREHHGIPQKEFADSIGMTKVAVRRWEHDEATPHISNLRKIAEFYGIPVNALANDDEIDYMKSRVKGRSSETESSDPDSRKLAIESLTDEELMLEVTKRYRVMARSAKEFFDRMDKVDWDDVAERLTATPLNKDIPADLEPIAEDLQAIRPILENTIMKFEPSFYKHPDLPQVSKMDVITLTEKWSHYLGADENAHNIARIYIELWNFSSDHPEGRSADKPYGHERIRSGLIRKLKELRNSESDQSS